MTTHTTMSYATALKMVISDGVKIARLHWQTEEWRKPRDRSPGTIAWIGCFSGRDFGIPNDLVWWPDGFRSNGGIVLYQATQCSPSTMCMITMGWAPTIDDTLASDWHIHKP